MKWLTLLCVLFWSAAGVFGLIYPDKDWHISFVIASFTLAWIHVLQIVLYRKDVKDEKESP